MNDRSNFAMRDRDDAADDGSVNALDCAVIVAFMTVLVVSAVGVMSRQTDTMLGRGAARSFHALDQPVARINGPGR